MAVIAKAIASKKSILLDDEIKDCLYQGLQDMFLNQKVLVLIPDHTRSLPVPFLFKCFVEILANVKELDFMIALGTHPHLSDDQINTLLGITAEERTTKYSNHSVLNHDWDDPSALVTIGTINKDEIKQLAGDDWHPSLGGDVPIKINRKVFDYDQILILGPTFPHEVVGFSGGAKYLFPGISGPEMINATHWLGALAGVIDTIGVQETSVRSMIHSAASFLTTPVTLISLVVVGEGLAGIFIGDHISAWESAAMLSAQRHILYFDSPFSKVLSWAPTMYDELWTAAKAVYKLEPVIEDGGEVIIYAPHLEFVSHVHGDYIFEIGYHVLEYYLNQWDRFKHLPLGVLAHSTHVRGAGRFEIGREYPRIKVTLSSKISHDLCEQLSLGYMNPEEIDLSRWKDRESEGILFVPKAGEMLYRVRKKPI